MNSYCCAMRRMPSSHRLGDMFFSCSSAGPHKSIITRTTTRSSTTMMMNRRIRPCCSVAAATRPTTISTTWGNCITILCGNTTTSPITSQVGRILLRPRSFSSLLSSSSSVSSAFAHQQPPLLQSRTTLLLDLSRYYFSAKAAPRPTRSYTSLSSPPKKKSAANKKKKAKKRSDAAAATNPLDPDKPRRPIVAIMGPPNSGKSTLFNKLLSKELNRSYRLGSDSKQRRQRSKLGSARSSKHSLLGRRPTHGQAMAIVSELRGTTRDARECIGAIGPVEFQLWDTAGVEGAWTAQQFLHAYSHDESIHDPKKPHVEQSLQYAMMKHTLRAAQQADVVLLLMDARGAGVTADLYETGKWLRQVSRTRNNNNSSTHKKNTNDDDDNSTQAATATPRTKPKIVLVANKLEGNQWNYAGSPILDHLDEAERRLGFGPPVLLSAIHGDGIADLAYIIQDVQDEIIQYEYGGKSGGDDVVAASSVTAKAMDETANEGDEDDEYNSDFDSDSDGNSDSEGSDKISGRDRKESPSTEGNNSDNEPTPKEKPLQLAILGRQNVGKSTLVNALLGHERCLVGPTPGLTRDAITSVFHWNNRPVQIVDTAGIRKRPQRDHDAGDIEDLAVQDALRAMKVADVAVLVIDAGARMLRRQELAIADAILKEGRSIVVAANKMDLVVQDDYTKQEFVDAVRAQLEGRFPLLRQTPIVAMSSLYDLSSVEDLMPVVFNARDRWQRTLTTAQLNRWIRDIRHGSAPSRVHGQQVKVKYIIQTKGRPPTFLLYCSTDQIPDSYARFLMRHFQDSFEMYGMEVRLVVKKSAPENPFNKEGPGHRKRSGYGLGGREARKKRNIKRLLDLFGKAKNKEEYRANMSEMPSWKRRQLKSKRHRKK